MAPYNTQVEVLGNPWQRETQSSAPSFVEECRPKGETQSSAASFVEEYRPKGEMKSSAKSIYEEFRPKVVSMSWNDSRLVKALEEGAQVGVLVVEDLSAAAPFRQIEGLMDLLNGDSGLGDRANAAYTKNKVYKDSAREGKSGLNVDEKRVFDISAERLETIENNDATLRADLGPDFEEAWKFQGELGEDIQRLLNALATVIGDPEMFAPEKYRKNFRMVDYHARPSESPAPRCGEHRDFGPMTLIFQDSGRDARGLQVHLDGVWMDIPVPKAGNSAVLLFGICAAWRSNDRVAAVKHRVENQPGCGDGDAKRRLSAVLFVGPREDATLAPLLLDGERRKWKTGLVKDVRQFVARKWKHREGTTSKEEDEEEEELKKRLPTQDHAIDYFYKIH